MKRAGNNVYAVSRLFLCSICSAGWLFHLPANYRSVGPVQKLKRRALKLDGGGLNQIRRASWSQVLSGEEKTTGEIMEVILSIL
jgi:hypothetical protein